MTALLRIDQTGLADGEPGKSRTDGKADGSLVTLSDTSPGAGSTEMRLLWTPPRDVGAVASLAATGDPKIWTFEPTAGKYGSYLVELVRNAGLLSETSERRVLVMRTPNLGLIIPALNERGYKTASLEDDRGGELVDNNATDFSDPDLNELPFASWWRALHELITAVDANGTGGAAVSVAHYSEDAASRQLFASLALALEASYSGGTAAMDIAPNGHDPAAGTFALAGGTSYVLRGAAGRASVVLPELTVDASVEVERCTVAGAVSGASALALRDAVVSAALQCDTLDARDASFGAGGSVSAASSARFDRCHFDAADIVCSATVDAAVTLINCTFGASPAIVFTEGEDIGAVRMDARSKFLWDAAGGSVTNGAPIVVEAP